MALQVTRTTKTGIDLPSAYVRIVNYTGDENNISITTVTHADAAARNSGKREVDSEYINIAAPGTIPAGGIIQWCYLQIKTRPEFTGYIDV